MDGRKHVQRIDEVPRHLPSELRPALAFGLSVLDNFQRKREAAPSPAAGPAMQRRMQPGLKLKIAEATQKEEL